MTLEVPVASETGPYASSSDDDVRTMHAYLVLEDARMHVHYGCRARLTSGGMVATQWDALRREIGQAERELARRGLEPTP